MACVPQPLKDGLDPCSLQQGAVKDSHRHRLEVAKSVHRRGVVITSKDGEGAWNPYERVSALLTGFLVWPALILTQVSSLTSWAN